MKTSEDYIGKAPFQLHFLIENLEDQKQLLKSIEEFNPTTQKSIELKQETIETIKNNIKTISQDIKNL